MARHAGARALSLLLLLATGLVPHEAKAELVRAALRPAAPAATAVNPDGSDDDSFSREPVARRRRPARLARLAPPRPEPEQRRLLKPLPVGFRSVPGLRARREPELPAVRPVPAVSASDPERGPPAA
jgi:hypothetical protein